MLQIIYLLDHLMLHLVKVLCVLFHSSIYLQDGMPMLLFDSLEALLQVDYLVHVVVLSVCVVLL